MSSCDEALRKGLVDLLGSEAVVTDTAELELFSSDAYSRGETAELAIKPTNRETLPGAIRLITEAGYVVFPRGGGMSYTSGYLPDRKQSVVIDTSALNAIVDLNANDMTITVEAGVTWQQIYQALLPQKLRLPFFGTFSGSKATVGGGMSNGALFMGTARYGTGADIVLGMEVVTAAGQVIKTGQSGFKNGKPFYRGHGPDLTGLFCHDAGTLGIKILITLRVIRKPIAEGYASFAYNNIEEAAAAMSDIARTGRVEEAYIFDPETSRSNLDAPSAIKTDFGRLMSVMKSQGGIIRGLRAGMSLVTAGRNFVAEDAYSLHVVCAANTHAEVNDDLKTCRNLANTHNGSEIANSIPKTARANPFGPNNGILGHKGQRWAALNAKVTHSDAPELIAKVYDLLEKYKDEMQANNIVCSKLFISISNHAFSVEPVLRWFDEWLPLHHDTPEKSYLAAIEEPQPNLVARQLVAQIRQEIVDLFADFGAASNQIGKTYHYFSSLQPETAMLIGGLKKILDPNLLMNPGALEFPE